MQRELNFVDPQDVLYIEDHPTNVHLMQALFKRCPSLNLVVARDGQEARRLASTLRPSLLLVDIRLPDCHGIELLEALRHCEGYTDIPAVAVTAESGFQLAGTSFCEVWPKPLDLAFVLERLGELSDALPPDPAVDAVQLLRVSPKASGISGQAACPNGRPHAENTPTSH